MESSPFLSGGGLVPQRDTRVRPRGQGGPEHFSMFSDPGAPQPEQVRVSAYSSEGCHSPVPSARRRSRSPSRQGSVNLVATGPMRMRSRQNDRLLDFEQAKRSVTPQPSRSERWGRGAGGQAAPQRQSGGHCDLRGGSSKYGEADPTPGKPVWGRVPSRAGMTTLRGSIEPPRP